MLWVGFDVGGTFVDIIAFDTDTGRFHFLKHRSSRRQAAASVRDGLALLLKETDKSPETIGRLAHGTTLVTNILVERTGARVGVLTTAGFRDVMEIGRMRRPSLYDLSKHKPVPLATRTDIREVGERIDADGKVLAPLDRAGVDAALAALRKDGIEAIAVCLLNAYANDSHEAEIGRLAEGAGFPVSLSSKVSAEYGEYERFTTCVMNSYVKPVAGRYFDGTVAGVGALGIRAPLEVMQSNGGVVPAATAAQFPVRLASSGPAAGVMGAAQLALRAGRGNIITFDMGGTSTDVSLVVGGEPAYVSEHDIEGLPIRAVGIDIRSIGAGGGSLARIDRTGALRVGPESAGADPGPACYGWGGSEPTVADADVALGYLNPVRFCDGRVPLDVDRARQALEGRVGRPRNVSAEEAALGILQVCVTNMVGAVRNITMEQGHDPRDFSLVAFGGAGPVHAAFVAEELGIPEVVILRDPGLLSAKGMLLTNYRADVFRTTIAALDGVDWARLNAGFQDMEAEARAQLVGEAATGSHRTRRILGMCYEGQQNIVPIDLASFPLDPGDAARISAALDEKFKAIYGFLPQSRRPQILHARVYVERLQDALKMLAKEAAAAGGATAKPSGHRPMMFPNDGATPRTVPVYDRDSLAPGAEITGPAVIEEGYSNTVMGPGHSARIDGYGNIMIRIG